MLSPDQLIYKILHKVVYHHEKQPTVKLIYIETMEETKLSETAYRLFLKDMETQGYLKIWAENKDDWGEIIVSPYGIQFVTEYTNSDAKPQVQNIPLSEEQEKQRDYDKWIDKNFTYRSTLIDFKRLLLASKKALPENEYIKKVLEWHDIYGNSAHYYSVWGPDYLHENHTEIYKQLIDEIDKINTNKPKNTDSLQSIFLGNDWQKYLDRLTTCSPQLLIKEGNSYRFIGSIKTQRGAVAQYFKYLKAKGIINQSLSRDEIAKVLSTSIKNYQINGSSIDNISALYRKTFQKQLETISIC